MRRQINLSKLKTRRLENGLGQPGPSAFSVGHVHATCCDICISGLVVEYIVAIDVTRVRFPADASFALVPILHIFSQRGLVSAATMFAACRDFVKSILHGESIFENAGNTEPGQTQWENIWANWACPEKQARALQAFHFKDRCRQSMKT